MKHYFNPMSRGATTAWMLNELEAPHEQVVLDFASGATRTPEFRSINPMGKLPTLVDGDIVVTETAAICAYLADKFADRGLAPSVDSPERGKYYRYLFFPGTTLEPLVSFNQHGVEGNPASDGWGDMERGMAAVESMTPDSGWALSEQFTAADVVFGGTLAFFCGLNLLKASPSVEAYIDRIKARPHYQATHAGF